MNYRHAQILAPRDLGPSGSEPITIKTSDPISRITLRHEPVAGSMIPAEHPVQNVVSLELIDGSDVLYSLSGQVGHALNIFDKTNPPIQQIQYNTGGTSIVVINMDFGRYLWDPELAFDPTKFKNPQLRITWNEANYNALCTAHDFMVYGSLFDEKVITPVGFLMSKEIKAYAPTSGANEYTDLPTDYPIRKLIVQPYRIAGGPRGIVDLYKLSEDNDKRTLFEGDLNHLRSFLDMEMGECEDHILVNCPLAGRAAYSTAAHLNAVSGYNSTAKNGWSCAVAGNQITPAPATAAANIILRAKGVNPHACVSFPFGNQDDLADWYDVTTKESVELRLRGGPAALATDTVKVATQQLRKY